MNINDFSYKNCREIEAIVENFAHSVKNNARFKWSSQKGLYTEKSYSWIISKIQTVIRRIFGVSQTELNEYKQIDSSMNQLLLRSNEMVMSLPGKINNLDKFKQNLQEICAKIHRINVYSFPRTKSAEKYIRDILSPPLEKLCIEESESLEADLVNIFKTYFSPSKISGRTTALDEPNTKGFFHNQINEPCYSVKKDICKNIRTLLAREHELFLWLQKRPGKQNKTMNKQQSIRVALLVLTYIFSHPNVCHRYKSDESPKTYARNANFPILQLTNALNPVLTLYANSLLTMNEESRASLFNDNCSQLYKMMERICRHVHSRGDFSFKKNDILLLKKFFNELPEIEDALLRKV